MKQSVSGFAQNNGRAHLCWAVCPDVFLMVTSSWLSRLSAASRMSPSISISLSDTSPLKYNYTKGMFLL